MNETLSILRKPADAVALLTFALWLTLLAAGIVGVVLPYRQQLPLPMQAEPMQAQLLDVKLRSDPYQEPQSSPSPPPPPTSR